MKGVAGMKEIGGDWISPSPKEKLTSKSPALLGLILQGPKKLCVVCSSSGYIVLFLFLLTFHYFPMLYVYLDETHYFICQFFSKSSWFVIDL